MRPAPLAPLLLLLAACGGSPQPAPQPTSRPAAEAHGQEHGAADDRQELLRRVAAIHGGAGPFAVAGFRMGQAALRQLGLEPGRFDLLVVHSCPAKVQWSCIADGLQAATGTSLGKLNLRWVETEQDVSSLIGTRDGKQGLVGRLSPAFVQRYLDTPRERLMAAGEEVAGLPEGEVFTLEPAPPLAGSGEGR